MQMHGVGGRARRAWDVGSRVRGDNPAFERMRRDVWPLAVRALGLDAGHAVLDVGCGTGNALVALRDAVGPAGSVHGVDVSPKMLGRARAVVRRHGWTNVELREADASRADLGRERYDAALASLSLSAVPDLAAAVDRVYAALRPGGRLFVLDAHFRPGPPQLARWFYRVALGANGDDVLAALRSRFERVAPVVSGDGRTVPHGEVAWPPVAAALATKAGPKFDIR